MNKKNLSKKLYILISIFLVILLGILVLVNRTDKNRESESGTIYVIMHMNTMADWALYSGDLYKESLPFPHKFSLLEKSIDKEKWDTLGSKIIVVE